VKKTNRTPVVLLAVLGLMFAFAAYAAGDATCEKGAKHWRHRAMYDTKTVETITGEVIKVKEFQHRRGPGSGIGLILKTDKEEIPVTLGPSRYLDTQNVKIGEKDRIEVTGSRVTGKHGKSLILAAQVKKGDAMLILRHEDGKPLWAGKKEKREMKEKMDQKEQK